METGTVVLEGGSIGEPEWGRFGGIWYHFDNIGIAMVSLFEVASLEGWVDVMNAGMDVTEVDQQPRENASWYMCLYFVTFICLGTFIVINLLVGVFVDSFYQAKGIGLLTDEQRKWHDLRNLIHSKHPKRIPDEEMRKFQDSNLRGHSEGKSELNLESNRCHQRDARAVLKHRSVVHFFTLCIALNMIVIGSQWYDMSDDVANSLRMANIVFVGIFVVEVCLKILAFGSKFWKRSWNKVDFVLMVFSSFEFIVLLDFLDPEVNDILTNLSRMFRPLRAIRLLEMSAGLRMLIRTFFYSLPAIGNVVSLAMLFLFIYAVLGVQLYATVQTGGALEGRAHFGNFASALSLVFRMTTGEDWQAVMHDCAVEPPDCGCICTADYAAGAAGPGEATPEFFQCRSLQDKDLIQDLCGDDGAVDTCGNYYSSLTYFISFFFLGAYCMTALFTAVILDCFSVVNHVDSAVVNLDCLKHFKSA